MNNVRKGSMLKKHFNELMLGMGDKLERRVLESDDPLKSAVQYAMMGNFIDFAALDNVEESKLMELIDRAPIIEVDAACLELMREQASSAETLTYITDNCGEIVMDKILIRQLKRQNPKLTVTVIVRGAPVANDATMEDAEEVGLTSEADCVGNGSSLMGTDLSDLSEKALALLNNADVLIAKGQGNFETFSTSGT